MAFTADTNGILTTGAETGAGAIAIAANATLLGDRARKTNWTATTNPSSANNLSQGYRAGSWWLNTSTAQMWQCVVSDNSTATWRNYSDDGHTHVSADITDASSTASADKLVKYDGEGDITVNRLDVASLYTTNEGVLINETSIYGVNADLTMRAGVFGGNLYLSDDIIINHADGIKIGTATTQKLGFFNATPIVQPANTTDLRTALINLGLYASGGASPLNLNGGTLTAATVNATTTLRGPYKGSSVSTATLGDGYDGGMDLTFVDGGILRFTETNVTGTNDVFHQFYPATTSGYGIVEAWSSAGLILGTGNNDNPITFRTNRVNRMRVASSGLNVWSDTTSAGGTVYLRTSTHDSLTSSYSLIWRNDLDNADVGIIKLDNPSANSFTMTLGTYQYPTTLSLSGGNLMLAGDLIGDGFWNIKGDSSGTGRIDIRADQVNCYASFNPQNSMFMGWSNGNVSFDFGWTGKTGGNYRSIYARYNNADLIWLSQWADGSWEHEMGRWTDHGTLTLTQGLKVDPSDGGYGVQFGSNAYDQILRNGNGLEILTSDHTRFVYGGSNEIMRINSGSVLIGQTSDDSYVPKLQVAGRIHIDSLGVGNSTSATGLGSVAYVIAIYDRADSLLGYLPLYNSYSA